MDKHPLMKCGHVALATDSNNRPVCPICSGTTSKAYEVVEIKPDLTGRSAICGYCKTVVPSKYELPFFGYKEGHPFDTYYCGCRGWD